MPLSIPITSSRPLAPLSATVLICSTSKRESPNLPTRLIGYLGRPRKLVMCRFFKTRRLNRRRYFCRTDA